MRLLYGIQGTGNGHITRARALVPALQAAGIEMDFIFSGRPQQDFVDMAIFGERCRYVRGLSLITEKGRLNTTRTVTENHFGEFIRDVRHLQLDGYDIVLSDFEPVTAWAAKLQGKTSVGISHQCAFLHDIPKMPGYHAAKSLMRFFAPTRINIGLHWHHFNQAILPPLIEAHQQKPVIANKILVYMGFEDLGDIIDFLMPCKNHHFVIYAKVAEIRYLGHITVKPFSAGFHKDLEDADGVISNAGFELASECLLLGKKLLIKPLLGQYEQLSNALALQLLNRASIMHSLNPDILKQWLCLSAHPPVNYPDTASHLAKWLVTGDLENTQGLVDTLWKGVAGTLPTCGNFRKL